METQLKEEIKIPQAAQSQQNGRCEAFETRKRRYAGAIGLQIET